jgi:hypothetical protein
MLQNFKTNRILWAITSALAIIAALPGILSRGAVYNQVVSTNLIPGAFGQDLISLLAAICLLALALSAKQGQTKKQIVALGILGYFFYAYGIYVIERAYNLFYLLYMAIFALSFWAIAYGVANIRREILQKIQLSNRIRITSLAVAILQPVVFYPLWISALLPLMRTHNKIESLYSIYILDLCFIMPAFLILVTMLARKKAIGYLLAPAIFVLGFTLIFSLTISELVKPVFQMIPSTSGVISSLALSLLFAVTAILHLKKTRVES